MTTKRNVYTKKPRLTKPGVFNVIMTIEDHEFPRFVNDDINNMVKEALAGYFVVIKISSERMKDEIKRSTNRKTSNLHTIR